MLSEAVPPSLRYDGPTAPVMPCPNWRYGFGAVVSRAAGDVT